MKDTRKVTDKEARNKVVAKTEKAVPKKLVVKEKTSRATGKPIVEKPKSKVKRPRKAPTKEVVGAVEKSVPIPEDKPKGKYPLDSMGPGESFLVQCAPKNAKRIRLSIMGATRRVSAKMGAEFLVQVRSEENGVRCWRTDNIDALVEREPIPLTETVSPDGVTPALALTPPGDFKLPI